MRSGLEDFKEGTKASFKGKKRIISTISFSISIFFLALIASSYKSFLQLSSMGTWNEAVIMPYWTMLSSSGYTGISLTLIFSILTGVAITNTGIQLLRKELDTSLLGAIPGFAAAGCASCGVGLVSVLGLGGIISSMPFQGNLIRLGTVGLLVLLIARNGDPDKCKI